MKRNIHLFIIDAQNDFCDLPADWLPPNPATFAAVAGGSPISPALPVAGAHADMLRLAEFMHKASRGFSDITVTLDSHHYVGIERPTFWMQGDGSAVAAFTQIDASDVRAGKYVPRNPKATARALSYLDALEAGGRYRLMVWPIHCEIGTWGHGVHAAVRTAYNEWEARELGIVNKVTKGSNPWTEHYSAVMAEVPDMDDPSTQLNRALIDILGASDEVIVAGEAGSHCVPATMYHVAEQFGIDNLHKLVILKDCMSPVTGFEAQFQTFLDDMSKRGAKVTTTADYLPEVLANGRR